MTRARAAIDESERKVEQVALDFRNAKRNELADATATLNSLSEGSVGLSDRVKQAEVRSPVRGTIKRLLVNTEGGVVLPGRDIVEIVPLDDTLLLEAKIAPRDIAFLSPGQHALVKFTAYDFLVYGGSRPRSRASAPTRSPTMRATRSTWCACARTRRCSATSCRSFPAWWPKWTS